MLQRQESVGAGRHVTPLDAHSVSCSQHCGFGPLQQCCAAQKSQQGLIKPPVGQRLRQHQLTSQPCCVTDRLLSESASNSQARFYAPPFYSNVGASDDMYSGRSSKQP